MTFINSFDEKHWKAVLTRWECPFTKVDGIKMPKYDLTWTIEEEKLINANSNAFYEIFYGIDP